MMNEDAIEAARAKGREIAGNQPGALVEAMGEIAVEGAKAYLSALPQQEPVAWQIPDGWALVPKAASAEMEIAAVSKVKPYHDEDWSQVMPKDLFRLAWPAMLAAAPATPVASPVSSPSEVESKKPLDRQWSGWVYDADHPMSDGGDTRMTAAEEVLAYLLVEIVGSPDDVQYSPNDAQRILEDRLKEGRRLETSYAELLDQRRTTRAEAAEAKLSSLDSENLTRPIVGMAFRTPQEVFDIMADRIRFALAPTSKPTHAELIRGLVGALKRIKQIADNRAEPVVYRVDDMRDEAEDALTRAAEAGFGGEK